MSVADPLAVTPEESLLRGKASRMTLAELSEQIWREELASMNARNDSQREEIGIRIDILKREVVIRAATALRAGEGAR